MTVSLLEFLVNPTFAADTPIPAMVGVVQSGGPWWLVIATGLPSMFAGFVAYTQWRASRKDKANEIGMSYTDRMLKEQDLRAENLSKETKAILDRVTEDVLNARSRNFELEKEIDRIRREANENDAAWRRKSARWEWLAVWWYRKANSIFHLVSDCYKTNADLSERLNIPASIPPILQLPQLEEPT